MVGPTNVSIPDSLLLLLDYDYITMSSSTLFGVVSFLHFSIFFLHLIKFHFFFLFLFLSLLILGVSFYFYFFGVFWF